MGMRGKTITEEVTLITETCCNCGVLFAMTDEFQRQKIKDKGTSSAWFYCPNGHSQHYTGKSDAQLRKEAEQRAATAQEEARIARIEADQARAAQRRTEAKLKAQTRRVTNGVCPCCNRTFRQLAAHMKRMHPESVT